MLQNEILNIKPKAVIGDNSNDPMAFIDNLDKFTFTFQGECDGKFAKRLAKLIESETKTGQK